ncbi:uncharacterized protein LOC110201036 isoform X1 [Phascolarctos cinereus]
MLLTPTRHLPILLWAILELVAAPNDARCPTRHCRSMGHPPYAKPPPRRAVAPAAPDNAPDSPSVFPERARDFLPRNQQMINLTSFCLHLLKTVSLKSSGLLAKHSQLLHLLVVKMISSFTSILKD